MLNIPIQTDLTPWPLIKYPQEYSLSEMEKLSPQLQGSGVRCSLMRHWKELIL